MNTRIYQLGRRKLTIHDERQPRGRPLERRDSATLPRFTWRDQRDPRLCIRP